MKYIKQFESKTTYKKGDYVLLSKSADRWTLPFAQIKSIKKGNRKNHFLDQYYIEVFSPNTDYWEFQPWPVSHGTDVYETWVTQYVIIQKLSKIQIEEFKLKIQALKYNL